MKIKLKLDVSETSKSVTISPEDLGYTDKEWRITHPVMTLIAKKIVNEGDRVLIYGHNPDYHIIASKDCNAKEGDEVEYEPYGWNFGWFISIVNK